MQLSLLSVAISTFLIFDFHPPLDLPVDKIKKCMGNPEADEENEVLKVEQERQVHTFYVYSYFQ